MIFNFLFFVFYSNFKRVNLGAAGETWFSQVKHQQLLKINYFVGLSLMTNRENDRKHKRLYKHSDQWMDIADFK